jgi:hypothetical protein
MLQEEGDERDVLEVLKFELDFLRKGGYGRSPREPWRAQLIFEDSPTCMNFENQESKQPCDQCVLMQFVPTENRAQTVPCRFIPLKPDGQTLNDLYRGGTQQEIEDALADWLRQTIARIEAERAQKKTKGTTKPGSQEKTTAAASHR